MTDAVAIPSTVLTTTVAGASGTGPWQFSFVWFEKADLAISVDGTLLPLDEFTVSGWVEADGGARIGGEITPTVALNNQTLVIDRSVTPQRLTDIAQGGATPEAINYELDKLTAMIVDIARTSDSISTISDMQTSIAALQSALSTAQNDIVGLQTSVSGLVGGSVDWKNSVRVATTELGDLATAYAAGQTVDAITLVAGDRILIKDQTTLSSNGVYVVQASGAPVRADDFDEDVEVTTGATVYVEEGAENGSSVQTLTTTGDIVIGTTGLTFADPTVTVGVGGVVDWKESVRVATTASGTLATAYEAGQVVDGITLGDGDRILLKNQVTASENGVYVVQLSGAPVRSDDFDENSEVTTGAAVFVEQGTENGSSLFFLSTVNPIVVGSTDLSFFELAVGGGSGEVVYATIAALSAAPAGTSNTDTARVIEPLRRGVFVWVPGDQSAVVSSDTQSGIYVAPASDPTGASGCWMRLYDGPALVTWFGATGDGVTDDVDSVRGALANADFVAFPQTDNHYQVSGVLNVTIPGQRIIGYGEKSQIRQSGINANSTVFSVSNAPGVRFESLYVRPGDTPNSTFNGQAFYCANSDRVKVLGCYVTHHRRGAVMLNGCDHCEISGMVIEDSVVGLVGEDTSTTGVDVWLCGGSSYNLVDNNIFKRGCGSAVAVQSITTSNCVHNVVSNNIIKEAYSYGIYFYANATSDLVDYNVAIGNNIDTVYGSVESVATTSNTFGAGIYFQGAAHSSAIGNTLKNCNVQTNSETLAPAAIGVTNCQTVTITGNTIINSNWYGIALFDPNNNVSFPDDTSQVTGNRIYNTTLSGIYIKDYENANISSNTIVGSGSRGIFARDVSQTQLDYFEICNNTIVNSGSSGMELSNANWMKVQGNRVHIAGSRGIVYSTVSQIDSANNTVNQCQQAGIYYISSQDITAVNDTVYDCGLANSNAYGFWLNGTTDAKLTGCVARNKNNANLDYGIYFSGGAQQILIEGGRYEGTTDDVGGVAPANIRWGSDVIASRPATFERKNRSISGNAMNVNDWDKHLYVTTATNLETINNGYSGQKLYLSFSAVVTVRHAVGNIFLNNDTDKVCGPSGSTRLVSITLQRFGNNWLQVS